MYADPSRRRRPSPAGAGAALIVNGAIIGALMFAAPNVIPGIVGDGPMKIFDVPPPPPPPPVEPPKAKDPVKPEVETTIYTPPTVVTPPVQLNNVATVTEPPLTPPPLPADPGSVTRPPVERVVPPPPFVPAALDPRFAGLLQPDYPASEIRAEREGKVTVRVLIGTDGRVKQVEQVNATSPAFFDATRRQALGRWRFKPATRGGVPEESWQTKTVTFVLNNG
ncbi:energy transducer TonB [Sphingomonas sp.]|uniref:energy transducer TonB n=1 Tax=Sphingomonas sp. TaxID=28214 RepID=UPI001B04C769|nr:energy transducer TonB [Sphingomonas sp.]MBO9714142.1 energy transducer TonB [Sphingomonas sp.]